MFGEFIAADRISPVAGGIRFPAGRDGPLPDIFRIRFIAVNFSKSSGPADRN